MVGATTLQPGQVTALELPMPMGMHSGMTGLHTFAIEVASNDPVEPTKTLIWRFRVL